MLTPHPMATSSILVRPTFHPTGSMMLNRMITTRVKPACPAAKEIIDGATPEISTASGKEDPQRDRVAADPDHDGRAHHEAHGRPADGAQGGGAGAQRVRAQHRQGAQDHPEAMLDVGDLDDRQRPAPAPPRRARRCGTTPSERRGARRAGSRTRSAAPRSAGPIRRSPDRLRHRPPRARRRPPSAVAMPKARAWKLGSSEDASPSLLIDAPHFGPRRHSARPSLTARSSIRLDTSTSSSASMSVRQPRGSTLAALVPAPGRRPGGRAPSQMRAAQRRSVSATASIISRTGELSSAAGLIAGRMRVAGDPLDPTHQLGQARPRRRPRRWAGTGCRRTGSATGRAPTPRPPRASAIEPRPAVRRPNQTATADTVADSRRRRLSCHGVGQTSMQAGCRTHRAKAHPSSRGPTAASRLGHRHRQHEDQERRGRRGRRLRRDDPDEEHARTPPPPSPPRRPPCRSRRPSPRR